MYFLEVLKSHLSSLNENIYKATFCTWHVDTAQTNLCPHSYEKSCSTAHSLVFYPSTPKWAELIIFTGFLLPCSLHGHRDARVAQSRQEAGPSSKEGKGIFISAAMHVLNYYFKYAKISNFPLTQKYLKHL